MTEPEDPPRLLDSGEVPAGLRETLHRARADVGTDAQVARLAAKLGPLLGPAPAAPTSVSAAGGGVGAKVGFGALALLAASGAAWLLSTRSAPAPVPAAQRSAAPVASVVSAPSVVSTAPLVVAPPSANAAPSTATSVSKPPPSKPLPVVPPTEAELLEQARSALRAGDSARALQRASEHAQRYPRGVLVQEREVLAIQALRRLGRDAEADRRAEAFSAAYPGSAFQRKLQR